MDGFVSFEFSFVKVGKIIETINNNNSKTNEMNAWQKQLNLCCAQKKV